MMKNPRSRCVEKVSRYWVFSKLVYFWAFLTGMLAELTVKNVEIEPPVLVKARWDHCKTANLRHTFPENGLIFVTFHPATYEELKVKNYNPCCHKNFL
jgi:hypothetical protein